MTTAEVQQAWTRSRSRSFEVDFDRDRELVCRAQAGDKTAFDELYACYFARLEKYCYRRLSDPFEAQDIAQEAFLKAWRALPNFAGDRRFYPWLSVIASNLCTDSLRRKRRFGPVLVAEPWERDVPSGSTTEDSVVASVEIDLAAKAYSQLSTRHKRVLELREHSGLSYQEIADEEGIRITTVETLIWRARRAFKREYSALADSDDRLAAIAGAGALQAGLLRRVLRFAAKTPVKIATVGPQAVATAVGSAVAATAIVIAATSAPPHQAHSAAPVATEVQRSTSTFPLSATTISGTRYAAGPASGAGTSSGNRTQASSAPPPAHTTEGGTTANLGSGPEPGSGVTKSIVSTTLSSIPPRSTQQVTKTAGGALGTLPATVETLVKKLEGTVASTVSETGKAAETTVGGVVGKGLQSIGGISGGVGSTVTTPVAQTPAPQNPVATILKSGGLFQNLLG